MEQWRTESRPSITGLGVVSGYGWGRKHLWDGLISGETAAAATPGYGSHLEYDAAWVARVADEGDPDDGPSRFSRAISASTREAVEDALARGWEPGRRVGLIHAIVLGEVDLWREFYLERGGLLPRREYLALMPSTPLHRVMKTYDFHGPCLAVSAMCASGNAALLTAKMWMDAGMADDVVVVASDLSATPENVRHFRDLGVAIADESPLTACRPFQEGSRGFTIGEASVAMVVTGRTEAPYATVRGGAMTNDAYHAISIAPDHAEVLRCFEDALADADTDAAEVAYVNAHGPGTAQCDAAETHALDDLFPGAEGIFSVKPLAGHCQGAAAAVELAAACLSFRYGVVPAPRQVAAGHSRLVDGVVARRSGVMLKSSLGMGGHNSVVVLAEP